jgi:hypothetical protein
VRIREMDKSVMAYRLGFARLVVIELAIFEVELEALHGFATLTEEFLQAQAERLSLEPSVPKDLQPGDEEFEAYAGWYQRREDLQATFPSILRSSLLISAYAMLENLMARICHGIAELKDHSVSLEDFHGKGIQRAKLYLNKVAQIEFPGNSQEWSRICSLGKLRNIVVHAGRAIRPDDRLRTEFKQVPGVSVDEEGEIRLDSDFIPSVVNSLRAFRARLEHALEPLSSQQAPPHVR